MEGNYVKLLLMLAVPGEDRICWLAGEFDSRRLKTPAWSVVNRTFPRSSAHMSANLGNSSWRITCGHCWHLGWWQPGLRSQHCENTVIHKARFKMVDKCINIFNPETCLRSDVFHSVSPKAPVIEIHHLCLFSFCVYEEISLRAVSSDTCQILSLYIKDADFCATETYSIKEASDKQHCWLSEG